MEGSSASQIVWLAAGSPEAQWPMESHGGHCATCGQSMSHGVDTSRINNISFSRHADFFRFGSHACPACAWLYSFPKQTHRNLLAVGGETLYWPMISWDSATPERPSWYAALCAINSMPADIPVVGVITTDPKPRLWPRAKVATIGSFGLYVHVTDWDRSGYVRLSLPRLLEIADFMIKILEAGFTKKRIGLSLFSDYARARKQFHDVAAWENDLRRMREETEFIPALLIAGKIKTQKYEGNADEQ